MVTPVGPNTKSSFIPSHAQMVDERSAISQPEDQFDSAKKPNPAILSELNLNYFSDTWEAAKLPNQMPNPLAFCIQKNFYQPSDSYIRDIPLRNQVTIQLQAQNPNNDVYWVESVGLFEVGFGIKGALPIGQFGWIAGGYVASQMVQYRTCTPMLVPKGASPQEQQAAIQTIRLPLSPQDALELPQGAEVELIGLSKNYASGAMGISFGSGVGLYYAGVSLGLGLQGATTHEYGITIMRLNSESGVRVQLNDATQAMTGLAAWIQAGLAAGTNALALPLWANGFLIPYMNKFGYMGVESLMGTLTSLTLYIGTNTGTKSSEIYSTNYDLSVEAERLAYDDTVKLRKIPPLPSIHITQHSTTTELNAGIILCGQKLLLASALRGLEAGYLTRRDGTEISYSDTSYKRANSSAFTGKKEIIWESFFICDTQKNTSIPTFRFRLTATDAYVGDKKLRKLCHFTQQLKVKQTRDISADFPPKSRLEKIIRGGTPYQTNIDIYFTQTGIDNIRKTTFEEACLAYLSSIVDLKSRLVPFLSTYQEETSKAQQARQLLKEFVRDIQDSPFSWLTSRSPPNKKRTLYRSLCGRDLATDSKLLVRAQKFATAIQKMGASNDLCQLSNFMTDLGKTKGFDYMETILALAKLAKEHNTLVHQLEFKGDGAQIHCEDEGAIATPQERFSQELNRI